MILTRVEERARDRRYQTGAEVLARQKEVPSRRLEQQTQIRYGGGNSPVRHDVVITPEDVGKLAVWAKEGYLAVAGNGLGGDTIAGPLTIGTPALSPPPLPATLVADQTVTRISAAGQPQIGLNLYTDAAGTLRYVDNGPGADLDVHTTTAGGAVVPRLAINVAANNTAGPGAPVVQRLGGLNIVAATDAGGNIAPFVVVGSGIDVPQPVFPRRDTLVAADLAVHADLVSGADDRVSRVGLNAFQDQAGAAWHYLTDGPGGTVTVHDANVGATPLPAASMRFGIADPGNAGDPLVNTPRFVMFGPSGTAADQTNMMLLVNTSGTPTLTQVQVGPPDSGGTGLRALVVPN